MRPWVKRKGQPITNDIPAYILLGVMGDDYVVEYCGQIKLLDKAQYEVVVTD